MKTKIKAPMNRKVAQRNQLILGQVKDLQEECAALTESIHAVGELFKSVTATGIYNRILRRKAIGSLRITDETIESIRSSLCALESVYSR